MSLTSTVYISVTSESIKQIQTILNTPKYTQRISITQTLHASRIEFRRDFR